jgi:hypothetical protein
MHVGMGNWFTEVFNAPGNIVQWMFPSTTPELATGRAEAVYETRLPPAPETAPKQKTWSVEDLWESVAQRGGTEQTLMKTLTSGGEPPPPPVRCQWYENYSPGDGKCHFGSTGLWVVAGGGLAALLLLRR